MNSGGVSDQAVQHFTLLTSKMHPYNRSFKSKQCSNVTGVIPNVCIFDMKKGPCKITILKHLDIVQTIEQPSPHNPDVSRPPNHPPEGWHFEGFLMNSFPLG